MTKPGASRIEEATTAADIALVKELFIAYADSLDFGLEFQDFEGEMANFPNRYAPPAGALVLARVGDEAAGAVGLRPLSPDICEMKRLYVDPRFRGLGLGEGLARHVIDLAQGKGYRAMRLDTVEGMMAAATGIYQKLGFRPIEPYTYNPIAGARCFELTLA